jgi:hypothetical protein
MAEIDTFNLRLEASLRAALDQVMIGAAHCPPPRYAGLKVVPLRAAGGRVPRRRLSLGGGLASAGLLFATAVGAVAATGTIQPGAWGASIAHDVQACASHFGGIGLGLAQCVRGGTASSAPGSVGAAGRARSAPPFATQHRQNSTDDAFSSGRGTPPAGRGDNGGGADSLSGQPGADPANGSGSVNGANTASKRGAAPGHSPTPGNSGAAPVGAAAGNNGTAPGRTGATPVSSPTPAGRGSTPPTAQDQRP